MKKIILAIDAANLHPNTIAFACTMARLSRSGLTALFMEENMIDDLPQRKMMFGMTYVETIVTEDFPDLKLKQIKSRENIHLFEKECREKNIPFLIHTCKHNPSKELIRASRFADLIIIDPETNFSDSKEHIPSEFIKQILSDSECPVLVTPAFFESPDEIIFCYDGTKASVFAMKHFSYLFPELNNKITIASVDEKENSELEEKEKLHEWLNEHYKTYECKLLHGMPEIELLDHLLHKKNAIVVMGAYGRNSISQFFKHSHADLIIKTVTQPVFIAHC